MAFVNRLLGRRHVEAPRAGQIWRSEHSGRAILVSDVEKTDTGEVLVSARYEERDKAREFNGIQQLYAYSLRSWRARVREEARFLELTLPPHYPPRPVPAPPAAAARESA